MVDDTADDSGCAHRRARCSVRPGHPGDQDAAGYGVIAGPIYVLVSLVQAVARDGFGLTRHAWSLLSNGGLGWIQVTNLVLTGLMTVAFGAGLRRALEPGRGGTRVARLVGAYGVGLVGAGVFRADPALGFPPGTPDGAADVSWHGMLHFVSGGIGFVGLIAACLVAARTLAAEGRQGLGGVLPRHRGAVPRRLRRRRDRSRQRRQQRGLHRSGRARLDLDLGARGSPHIGPPANRRSGPAPTGLVRRVDATASRSRRNDQGQPDPAEDSQKEISRCVTWCC